MKKKTPKKSRPTKSGNVRGTVRGRRTTYFEKREGEKRDSRVTIANYVVDKYLREGDSILIDAGTSLSPIAEHVAARALERPETTHFTIMTHNYKAFQIMVDKVPSEANVNIVLAGGRYDRDLNALFGPQTITAYQRFFPRVVLIGISGMVSVQGLFCHGNTEELAVKEVICQKSARDRIVIADYRKLGLPDALCFGETANLVLGVDQCVVVTDTPDPDEDEKLRNKFNNEVESLRAAGILVDVVRAPSRRP